MGIDQSSCRIVIVTGLSGSGKSSALNALEDCGYFCIDNLPILLLPKFLALHNQSNPEFNKLGIGMDMREKRFVYWFQEIFSQIEAQKYRLEILFLEASDHVLVKRFSETRRPHPLAQEGNLLEGIRRERELMQPVRDVANEIVDTSKTNIHQLRDLIKLRFAQPETGHRMSIEFLSFGYKYGVPPEADIIMDVRFLPNPFYLDELRELDGRDHRIVEYVMNSEESTQFVRQFGNLLEFVLPLYAREGKSYLTIAVGCTGGQHRSVTITNELAQRLDGTPFNVSVRHRDILDRTTET